MPRGNQFARQWCLVQLLGRPQGLAVEDAARELGCAVRTVWRDLRVLEEAGFPIYDERDGHRGVWKVDEGFRNRLPIPLSLPEVVALLLSRDLLDHQGAGPFGSAVASAFAKIRALLSPRALELVDRMRAGVGARSVGARLEIGEREHIEEIHHAVGEQRRLRMRYYSLNRGEETERDVDPYHVTYFGGALYLVGHCHLRRDVRVFAVERIRALTTLSTTFSPPADFDVDAYLRGAWGIVRGDQIAIRAVFSPAVAPYVRGRLWHSSQELRELPDDRLEVRLRVADTLEVRRWLQGFGAEVEILAPPALREVIRRAGSLRARLRPQAVGPRRRPSPCGLRIARGRACHQELKRPG